MMGAGEQGAYASWEALRDLQEWFYNELDELYRWVLLQQEVIPKLYVTNQMRIPTPNITE